MRPLRRPPRRTIRDSEPLPLLPGGEGCVRKGLMNSGGGGAFCLKLCLGITYLVKYLLGLAGLPN